MSKGQESLLGASGSQESALGPNAAERYPTADDIAATLDAIGRICERYERTMASKAHHCITEIAGAVRNCKTRSAAGQEGGAA
jgi:hypothetical protein